MKITFAAIAVVSGFAGTHADAAPPLPDTMVRLALSGSEVDGNFVTDGLSISVGAGSTQLSGTTFGTPGAGIGTAVAVGGATVSVDGEDVVTTSPYEKKIICFPDPCAP